VSDLVAIDDGRALGPSEARRLTDQVKQDVQELWTKLVRLYEAGAHTSLGYDSWAAYTAAEFGVGQSRAYQLLDAGRVVDAIGGHSTNGGTDDLNERQARELVPLLCEEGAEGVLEAWREARDKAESLGTKLTTKIVRAAVDKRVGRIEEANRPVHTCEVHTCADCGATWAGEA
jgi:hypothetical protein